ncbi:MAG: ABC transporter permease subunit [Chloroflexi bacterium]|nr:ABC transporter permease subunit [Chloroflexota bacterium]
MPYGRERRLHVPLIGALVIKEFQTWLRGRLTFAAFTLLVLLVALMVFLLGTLILAPDANAAPALFSTTSTTSTNILVANRAVFLFGAVGVCVILAAAVVAPAVAASAFASERERGTLDLLLLQGPGPARIVLGKVLAALVFSLLLLAVGIPFFAPAWSFGGVQADQVIAMITIVCTVTLFYCALGVFFGSLFKSTLPAAMFAQGVALFMVFGTLGLHLTFAILSGNDAFRPLLWLNPFLALLSGGGSATDSFARGAPVAYRNVLSLPPQSWAPGVLLPAWVIGSLAWTALAVLLVAGATVAIEPTHPLKGRRAR